VGKLRPRRDSKVSRLPHAGALIFYKAVTNRVCELCDNSKIGINPIFMLYGSARAEPGEVPELRSV